MGARISLVVGLAATTLNVVVALLVGGVSGFLGGKLDLAVQRFVDAWMAFPASLSFLGFGLPIQVPSWGGMLSREGRRFTEQAPWLAFWPGLCLTAVVYSLNMFGNAMRDLLDPRLRGSGGRLGAGR